jgi:hypothetical protein
MGRHLAPDGAAIGFEEPEVDQLTRFADRGLLQSQTQVASILGVNELGQRSADQGFRVALEQQVGGRGRIEKNPVGIVLRDEVLAPLGDPPESKLRGLQRGHRPVSIGRVMEHHQDARHDPSRVAFRGCDPGVPGIVLTTSEADLEPSAHPTARGRDHGLRPEMARLARESELR